MRIERDLVGNTDAAVWAREFAKMVVVHPEIPTDEGTLIGWFANAIMAGYDQGRREERSINLIDRIREMVGQAAGASAGVCMSHCPDLVMPSTEISEAIDRIMDEFGVIHIKEEEVK